MTRRSGRSTRPAGGSSNFVAHRREPGAHRRTRPGAQQVARAGVGRRGRFRRRWRFLRRRRYSYLPGIGRRHRFAGSVDASEVDLRWTGGTTPMQSAAKGRRPRRMGARVIWTVADGLAPVVRGFKCHRRNRLQTRKGTRRTPTSSVRRQCRTRAVQYQGEISRGLALPPPT